MLGFIGSLNGRHIEPLRKCITNHFCISQRCAGENPSDTWEYVGQEPAVTCLAFEEFAFEVGSVAAAAVEEDDGVGVFGFWGDGVHVGGIGGFHV